MPRGNKRGPMGQGPSTGRGLGYCAGHDEPGFMAEAPRQGGAGKGRGAGRGQGQGLRPGRGCGGGRGLGRGLGRGSETGHGRGRGRGFGQGLAGAHHHDEHDELTALYHRIQQLEDRLTKDSEES
jgi:hypothetical protein